MEKNVVVKMKDGAERMLLNLKQTDLTSIVLEKDDDKNDVFRLRKQTISENPDSFVERRLYKWATMPQIVMYDLTIPKTINKAIALHKETEVLRAFVESLRTTSDRDNSGIVKDTGTKEAKKMIDRMALIDPVTAEGKKKIKELSVLLGESEDTILSIINKKRAVQGKSSEHEKAKTENVIVKKGEKK